MTVKYANNAWSYLGANVSAAQTTLIVSSGAKFPTLAGGDYFYATLVSLTGGFDATGNPNVFEIVKVNGPYTSGATTFASVTRAQDGTSAKTFSSGDLCDVRPCRVALTDLASVGGALLAVNNLSDVASVPTSINNLGLRIVSVRNYGAVGDGTTDDLAAINAAYAALPATGGVLYFPAGSYKVTGSITTIAKKIWILGQGKENSRILTNQATGNVLDISSTDVKISDMTVVSTVVRSANSLVNVQSGATRFEMQSCALSTGFINITTAATIVDIHDCQILSPTAATGTGILVNGGSDLSISHCLVNGTGGAEPLYGIRVQACGDLNLVDTSIILSGTALQVDPAAGQVVASLNATNTYFDTNASRGVNIAPTATGAVVRCSFVQCWMSSNTSNGVRIIAGGSTIVNGIDFIGSNIFLNGADGLAVTTSPLNIRVLGGEFAQNTGAGISFTSCTDFSVIGVRSGAGGGLTGNTTYGVNIASATCDNFVVANNDLRGNTTAPWNNASTVTTNTWSLYNNLGGAAEPLIATTKFTADFFSATPNNRFRFQSYTGNNITDVAATPSGSGTLAQYSAYGGADLTAARSYIALRANEGSGSCEVRSDQINGGTVQPLSLVNNGTRWKSLVTGTRILVGSPIGTDDVIHDFQINGNVKATAYHPAVATKTAATYTATISDTVLLLDATSNNIVITLPAASAAGAGFSCSLRFKRTDSTANTVTIQRAGADTIDGGTTTTLAPLQAKDLESNGVAAWFIC